MQKSLKKVSVSIVSFNNRGIIADCLDSVMAQDYPEVEVVLVDNASSDGTAGFVRARYPGVRVIENSDNILFCRGQNQGISATDGEYVLALNSDVVLDARFITEAVAAMEKDPRIGSVSGRVLRPGGELLDGAGMSLGANRKAVDRGYGGPAEGRFTEPGYVFGACGSCPLYRREMLGDVKLEGEYFDETYEMYGEDLDLAWRASRRGWKAYYTPAAVAYHERGGTARSGQPRAAFRRYNFAWLSDGMKARVLRNRYLTMVKNESLPGLLAHLPSIVLYDAAVWAYVLLFSPGAIPHFVRGLHAFRAAWRRRGLIHGC